MNQEGMPLKFRAGVNANTTIHFTLRDVIHPNEGFSIRELLIPWLLAGNIPDQAIGATDSSDPKQELYVGDLIEFEFKGEQVIGLIIWKNWKVLIQFKHESPPGEVDDISGELYYLNRECGQTFKRLTSRHTKKGKEILKKAGLG